MINSSEEAVKCQIYINELKCAEKNLGCLKKHLQNAWDINLNPLSTKLKWG